MKSEEAIREFDKKIPGGSKRHVLWVEKNGPEMLATELEKRLPEGTPVDRCRLKAVYEFEVSGQLLTVGNDEFFAVAAKRNGPPYALSEIIVQEAEAILNSTTFLHDVAHGAFLMARLRSSLPPGKALVGG